MLPGGVCCGFLHFAFRFLLLSSCHSRSAHCRGCTFCSSQIRSGVPPVCPLHHCREHVCAPAHVAVCLSCHLHTYKTCHNPARCPQCQPNEISPTEAQAILCGGLYPSWVIGKDKQWSGRWQHSEEIRPTHWPSPGSVPQQQKERQQECKDACLYSSALQEQVLGPSPAFSSVKVLQR